MASSAPGALDGVRVLDLTTEMGQYCGKLLADLGADVIKVEPPGGDAARGIGPFFHDQIGRETSLAYWYFNTNKRSVTCDLDQHDGQHLLKTLVSSADVLLESFPPGHMESRDIGSDVLLARKPDLVYVSISGFGRDGPHAHWKATDIVALAMSGVMTLAGDRDDPPNAIYGSQSYITASIAAAQGALIAFYHREHGGAGQVVEVSAQEAISVAQETAMQFWDMQHVTRERTGSAPRFPGVGMYETMDGHIFCNVGAKGFGANWTTLVAWMDEEGKAGELADPANAAKLDFFDLRILSNSALDPSLLDDVRPLLPRAQDLLEKFFASKTTVECYEEGQARRLLVGGVASPQDVVDDPQLAARDWFVAVQHHDEAVTFPGPPYRLSVSPASLRRGAPSIGEHNVDVWSEVGVSRDDLLAYASEGAV